jgi:hypothetical protein
MRLLDLALDEAVHDVDWLDLLAGSPIRNSAYHIHLERRLALSFHPATPSENLTRCMSVSCACSLAAFPRSLAAFPFISLNLFRLLNIQSAHTRQ